MRKSIILLLTFLYVSGFIPSRLVRSVSWAEVERGQIVLSVLDGIEAKINAQADYAAADGDCRQRETALAEAIKKAEQLLRERPIKQSSEQCAALAEAKISFPQVSPRQNFLSDFYLYSPLLTSINNLAGLSPVYSYGFDDFVWTKPELRKHTWELGTEISSIKYREPGVMEEKGAMYGVVGSYTYHNGLMLKAEGKGSWGEVDYENSGTMNDIDDYMLEFRGLGGYDFPISGITDFPPCFFTPYLGLGYRYLHDDMGGRTSSTGAWGYEREISYLYSPIGLGFISNSTNGYSISGTAEFDYFWDGTVKSNMGYLPGYYDIENDQDKGHGCRGSLRFGKKGRTIDFEMGVFVRYWKIKESKISTDPGGTSWVEPQNNSMEVGGRFTLMF